MKKLIYLIIFVSFFSCKSEKNQIFDTPQTVIVSGRVYDYHPDYMSLHISVNRLGQHQERIDIPFDSTGYFHATFETYLPTDFWIVYRAQILAIAHPNDSIYVEFDASKSERTEVLKTIKYGGDASKTNQDISLMQYKYEEFKLNSYEERMKAIKDLDTKEYLLHIDSVFQYNTKRYNDFILEIKPTEEARLWAYMYIEKAYFDALDQYPGAHSYMNNLNDFNVELSYYDPLNKRLPLNKAMLTNAYSMDSYISKMRGYVFQQIRSANKNNTAAINLDSLYTYEIPKYVTDRELLQLVLFSQFYGKLYSNKINFFKQNKEFADLYIKDPFLKDPLNALYIKKKKELEAPKIMSDSIYSILRNSSVGPIIDSILIKNKGKVIYIDCWAVWCAPCIARFPDSKKLHEELNGQAISFVYLCLESDLGKWQNLVKKHELEGENYLFNDLQSKELRKAFEVDGIPHYILIDKNGIIFERNAASPGVETEKIVKLINE